MKYFYKFFTFSIINILKEFPLYVPCSAGNYNNKSKLTIKNIKNIFGSINALFLFENSKPNIHKVEDFYNNKRNEKIDNVSKELKERLIENKSDKPYINYHLIYSVIFENKTEIKNLFEIGLGTNDITKTSHMGIYGVPGASLMAFRVILSNANIFGADIDKNILFIDERIKTYFIDQTEQSTFDDIDKYIPNNLDLVIDDGLHSTDTNINTLLFGLKKVKIGGGVVIENIDLNFKYF